MSPRLRRALAVFFIFLIGGVALGAATTTGVGVIVVAIGTLIAIIMAFAGHSDDVRDDEGYDDYPQRPY